ncbi:MAG: SIS domain-containing protein [Candidatus Vogelbacteria bacterium]|nr:SIS domain-containing protein [Candidatus Vogelbacteria bacterium]
MTPKEYFVQLCKTLDTLDYSNVESLISAIRETQARGGTVYVFGNGGSGANASHFAQDLLKCPIRDFGSRSGRYKTICLNDNTPVLMAYANDMNYEDIFVQQLMNFCEKNDLVIGISGSGNSMNVVKAIEYARGIGTRTFVIVGFDGGKLLTTAERAVHAKTSNMQIYEDIAMMTMHSIVTALKESVPQ